MMEEPGNMMLVEGDNEVKAWLRTESGRVDDWLYEMADALTFYAAGRMREHAPGSISELVDVTPAYETETGSFEGVAGIVPAISEDTFGRGLGSDPADYPVFVEVGTGIFGPEGRVISSIPGHLMGPFWSSDYGRNIYVQTIKGQKPQHYTRNAFEELVERTPVAIKAALPELGRRE